MIEKLRNIAIIAHIDHGKTTLIDKLLQHSGTLKNRQIKFERIMDSSDLEKERGIIMQFLEVIFFNISNVKRNLGHKTRR